MQTQSTVPIVNIQPVENTAATVGQVTFAQQFPNSLTAEVIASKFGKTVNDVLDENVLSCTELNLKEQGLTDIKGKEV